MVLFLDSGIGGLSYCAYFLSRNPGYTALYFADREGFPYGAKSKEELVSMLCSRLSVLAGRFTIEAAVLACNTASVSALGELRKRFPDIPFVGTVPAIKPAIQASRNGIIGVLGTERTINDPYIDNLARGGKTCRIIKIAAPALVEFVENQLDGSEAAERHGAVSPYMETFKKEGADGVVLGCTHFLLLRDVFKAAAYPGISLYDSLEGVTGRVESLLRRNAGTRAGTDKTGATLVLSGKEKPENIWVKRAREYGMELCLLDG